MDIFKTLLIQNPPNLALEGQVSYQGTWDASANSPALTSSVGTKGYYYVVSTSGSTNLNGVTTWTVGDWAIFNGAVWQKVDNTDAITSINGTTNQIVASSSTGDVTLSLPTTIANVNSITAQSATNLTLNGGSSGASIVAGQGTNANVTLTPSGTGVISYSTEIRKLAGTTGYFLFTNDGGGNTGFYYPGSNAIDFYSNSVNAMRIASTRNVLIGTTNDAANAKLNVAGNNNAALRIDQGGLNYYAATQHIFTNPAFATEYARFVANGNLLLSTTTDSSNGKLQLATHNTIAGGIGFGTDVSLIRAGAGNLQILSGSTTGAKLTLYAPDSTSANTLSWAHPGSRFWDLGTVAGSVATLKLTVTSSSSATFSIDPNVSIAATTVSSSTTSGALIVSGGIGAAGSIYSSGKTITNSSTGTTAQAALNFGNGSYSGRLAVNGTAYANDGVAGSNRTELQAPFSLNIISSQFKFFANSAGAGEGTSGAANIFNIYGPNFGGRMEHLVQGQSASPYLASATIGAFTSWNTATVTDNSTAASGTAASQVFHNFRQPVLAATNASVTTTDAATLYVAGGPAAGTNQTITNSYGLWNAGKTRLDSTVLVGTGTNSSNGILQLATHSTSAGGIGFGTDIQFFRAGTKLLNITSAGTNFVGFQPDASTFNLQVSTSGSDAVIRLTRQAVADWDIFAGSSFIIKKDGTTALTLDSSQNATFAGKITANGAGSTFKGTTTNDSAAAGYVGEYVSSIIASGSAVSLTNNTVADVTSISLTAGDWDVVGNVVFTPQTTTVRTRSIGAVNSTSATLPATYYRNTLTLGTTDSAGEAYGGPSPVQRISLSATTTIYLVAYAQFSGGTQTAHGYIAARRIR